MSVQSILTATPPTIGQVMSAFGEKVNMFVALARIQSVPSSAMLILPGILRVDTDPAYVALAQERVTAERAA